MDDSNDNNNDNYTNKVSLNDSPSTLRDVKMIK